MELVVIFNGEGEGRTADPAKSYKLARTAAGSQFILAHSGWLVCSVEALARITRITQHKTKQCLWLQAAV